MRSQLPCIQFPHPAKSERASLHPPGAHEASSIRSRTSYLIDDILELTVNSSTASNRDRKAADASGLKTGDTNSSSQSSSGQSDRMALDEVGASDLSRPKVFHANVGSDEDTNGASMDAGYNDNDADDNLSDIIDVIHD